MAFPNLHKKANLDRFKQFLSERGASIEEPTNEWELVRFKTMHALGIVYTNKKKEITPVGPACIALQAFSNRALAWNAGFKTDRVKMKPHVKALLTRDGDECFYCLDRMHDMDITVDHLVAIAHGGPNHISNMVLAHKDCNARLGHLSAIEKIRQRETVLLHLKHAKD